MDPKLYTPRVGLWSQKDLRWALKRLGQSGARMGPKGCAVTCMAIILLRWYYDIHKTNPPKIWRPGDLCDYMSSHNKFTPQGDAYLNTLDTLSGGHCINVYDPKIAHYVMVMVVWAESNHWVVKLDGDLCLDPWDGQIKKLEQSKWRVTTSRRFYQVR